VTARNIAAGRRHPRSDCPLCDGPLCDGIVQQVILSNDFATNFPAEVRFSGTDRILAMPFDDPRSARAFPSKVALWRRPLFTVPLILAMMGAVPGVVRGQQKARLPGEDWIRLFNGNDLGGWTKIGNESWTVEDGLIHGKGLTQDYGYLQTEKDYKDFQLSLRFKCVGDGNSGVFFHTAFKPGTADVTQGMQFEIDCTMMHHTAGVYAEDGRGWVVWPAPENEGVVRMGDWNDYLVQVNGNRYQSRLNGVPMVDFTDPKPTSFDGKIALQLHAGGRGNMEFKDIWIRDLSHR
jgi:hypothetical protein